MLAPTDQITEHPGTAVAGPGTAVFLPGPVQPADRQRDQRRHRLARRVSSTCPMAVYLLLPVVAYQLTGSRLWPAVALAVGWLPHLATPMLVRVVPARLDRRRLIITIDAANAAVLASVPITFAVDVLSAPHLLVVAVVTQLLFVCHEAAYAAIAPYRPRSRRLKMPFGMPLISGERAGLTALLLASALLVLTAVPPLLTVDGISLVASVLLVRALAAPVEALVAPAIPRPRHAAGARRRLTVLRERKLDLLHALICALYAAAGGALLGQFVPWLNQVLGVGPVRDVRLGLLLAAGAGGGWLARAVLPRLSTRLAGSGLLTPATADRLVTTGVLPQADADRLVTGPSKAWAAGITGVLHRVISGLGGYRVTLAVLPGSALLLLGVVLAGHWIVAAPLLAGWGTAYLLVLLDARVGESNLRLLAVGLGWPVGAVLGGVIAGGVGLGPRLGIVSGVLAIVVAAVLAWGSPLRTAQRG